MILSFHVWIYVQIINLEIPIKKAQLEGSVVEEGSHSNLNNIYIMYMYELVLCKRIFLILLLNLGSN